MGLKIEYGEPENKDGSHRDACWYVRRVIPFTDEQGRESSIVIAGFHRKIDAEIACKHLNESGIDWTGSIKEINAAIRERGGLKWLKQTACEHLQW